MLLRVSSFQVDQRTYTCWPEELQMMTLLSRLQEASRLSSGDHSTSITLLLQKTSNVYNLMCVHLQAMPLNHVCAGSHGGQSHLQDNGHLSEFIWWRVVHTCVAAGKQVIFDFQVGKLIFKAFSLSWDISHNA